MKLEEKLIYFVILVAMCLIIIFDSTQELSKNASEEELKTTKPIILTNLIISIFFLLVSISIYIFNN